MGKRAIGQNMFMTGLSVRSTWGSCEPGGFAALRTLLPFAQAVCDAE